MNRQTSTYELRDDTVETLIEMLQVRSGANQIMNYDRRCAVAGHLEDQHPSSQ